MSLVRDGYQVFEGVFAPAEVKAMLSIMADSTHSHSDLLWAVRSDERILRIFSTVWGVPDDRLLSSFDGATFTEAWQPTDGMPWHVDQNGSHGRGGLAGVQGVLTLRDVTRRSGGTVFLAGSHRYHKAVVRRNCADPLCDDDWEYFEVPESDPIFRRGLQVEQPEMAQGSVLLWDSRLVHRVAAPSAVTPRAVVYLSMAPRHLTTDDVLRRRRRGYNDGVSTTHWTSRFIDRGGERRRPSAPYRRAPPAVQRLVA